jgi:hypothetical protein
VVSWPLALGSVLKKHIMVGAHDRGDTQLMVFEKQKRETGKGWETNISFKGICQ